MLLSAAEEHSWPGSHLPVSICLPSSAGAAPLTSKRAATATTLRTLIDSQSQGSGSPPPPPVQCPVQSMVARSLEMTRALLQPPIVLLKKATSSFDCLSELRSGLLAIDCSSSNSSIIGWRIEICNYTAVCRASALKSEVFMAERRQWRIFAPLSGHFSPTSEHLSVYCAPPLLILDCLLLLSSAIITTG